MVRSPVDTEGLLSALANGDRAAFDDLYSLVYAELRTIAERKLRREPSGPTLQPTALVNDVYVKLVGQRQAKFQDRAHFLHVAATAMRRLLVDRARRSRRSRTELSASVVIGARSDPIDVVALDQALTQLATFGPLGVRQAKVVELRYLAGMTEDETAEVIGISSSQVKRDWKTARAWLHAQLDEQPPAARRRAKSQSD